MAISVDEIEALSVSWIKGQTECNHSKTDRSDATNDQALEWILALHEFSDDHPEAVLDVLLRIAELTDDDHILGMLGAGPLEDWMDEHLNARICPAIAACNLDYFGRCVKERPKIKRAIPHVWRRETTKFVFDAFQALAAPTSE